VAGNTWDDTNSILDADRVPFSTRSYTMGAEIYFAQRKPAEKWSQAPASALCTGLRVDGAKPPSRTRAVFGWCIGAKPLTSYHLHFYISQIYHRWRFIRPQFMGQVVVTNPHPRAPIWTTISHRLPSDYSLSIFITISVQTMRKSFLCFCCTKLFIMK